MSGNGPRIHLDNGGVTNYNAFVVGICLVEDGLMKKCMVSFD